MGETFINHDLTKLPLSPKRLAKAADAAEGWTWNSSFASVSNDGNGHAVDSIVVRCTKTDVRVAARWESVDGGKLALAVAWHYVAGQWPRQVNLAQALAIITG